MAEVAAADAAKSRNVRAWCVYDFATQGYQVTTASALLPAYFAQGIVTEPVMVLGTEVPAEGLWAFGVGAAAIAVFTMAPILGAIADYTFLKKRFMRAFAFSGSLFASLLFFATPGAVWFSLIFFVLAQICYTAGNVFYDAFLPTIVPDEDVDRVSGRGFAYGYLGGFAQFGIALFLVAGYDFIGISEVVAIRIALLSAGLWWIGFSIYTFLYLEEDLPAGHQRKKVSEIPDVVRHGVRRTIDVTKQLPKFPAMLLFLVAFLFYNDGIQTVISVAGVYGSGTLQLSTQVIMVTFLLVQGIAIFGAIAFSRIAGWIGTKRAIMVSLVAWCGIVLFAYFLEAGAATGFMLLGCAVGLILGGSQALSRSLFASMIPKQASAGFFGFFSVFNKLSAIAGPLIFGFLTVWFGSARPAILAITAFFVIGTILLAFLDLARARAERILWRFEGDEVVNPFIQDAPDSLS